MKTKTPAPTITTIECDVDQVSAAIVAVVDTDGPGLSEQRERQLKGKVAAILKRHATQPKTSTSKLS